jgi:hypothetical protein
MNRPVNSVETDDQGFPILFSVPFSGAVGVRSQNWKALRPMSAHPFFAGPRLLLLEGAAYGCSP